MIREKRPLLSRVADSVYWMARYIERAENVARFIGVNLNLQIDLPLAPAQQWQPLVDTSGDAEVFKERFGLATQLRVIEWLAYDTENLSSIASCLRLAREAGIAGGLAPCVLNAANEVAVKAFLDRRIRFTEIPRIIEECLERCVATAEVSRDALRECDCAAREEAQNLVRERSPVLSGGAS